FSLSDTFDTLGTFIGTGRRSGIFSAEDEKAMEESSGFKSKMDKALFADSIATSIGAIFGTSNTTTYVESAAGISVGGRTGLTSVVVCICFAVSAFFAPIISAIPSAATSCALVMVGILMIAALDDVKWDDLEEAIPCFGAAIFMGLCYSITDGIAVSFLMYVLVKIVKGKTKDINPILWVSSFLFLLNYFLKAII
ncbi:MAG: NCS2 family permease, partial [Erysipelotrichaceae bacterium]|nr:NCS2 family permease [Erysipelotrichaceae bacterium]